MVKKWVCIKMKSLFSLFFLCCLMVSSSEKFASGGSPRNREEREVPIPSFFKKNQESATFNKTVSSIPTPQSISNTNLIAQASRPTNNKASFAKPVTTTEIKPEDKSLLNEENLATQNVELDELRLKLQEQLKQKKYEKALESLEQIPKNLRTEKESNLVKNFNLFKRIDELEKENDSQFKRKSDLDEDTKKFMDRLFSEAQQFFLEGDKQIAQDLLIQVLFLDRTNFKAKKFLEYGLELGLGAYAIENMESKYWKLSDVYFYGGNYEKSIQALKLLSVFDPKNPLIFEKMGSTYYMMGETKKAINAWNTAIFLDPSNKELPLVIQNATQEMEKQDQEIKERIANRGKQRDSQSKNKAETQLLGVFNEQSKAYDYAQKVKQQKPGVEVIVEQDNEGKWTVAVPKGK